MPTIPQLPAATGAGNADELPLSQAGVTRSVSVSELLSGVQSAITLPNGALLGRTSLGPGGPEPVALGAGLAVQGGALVATGADHLGLPVTQSVAVTDEVIVNVAAGAAQAPVAALRSIFSAGSNVVIGTDGVVSANTDPRVSAQIGTLSQSVAAVSGSLTALSARVPAGGFAAVNAQGQVISPVVGDVSGALVTAGTANPSRSLATRAADRLNVRDYGAATDGSDASPGFNAAFNALPASGGEIFVPAGDYQLASPLVWAGKAFTLTGAGKGITRLHFQHNGIGFDITQTNPLTRVAFRDFSAYSENPSGPTAAVARLSYPKVASLGYVTGYISNIECFGYPNAANGSPPFPQTFLRGFILNNCWSVQVDNISWFGPPASAGSTNTAVLELNGSVDTRIKAIQAYYGNTVVLQTGYCEGIYFTNPLVVGVDYLFRQSDITTWPGYAPGKVMLLGFWACNGEVNTNLGTVQATALNGGYFVGMDFTRNGGPNSPRNFFDFTNVANVHVIGCNFIGGPTGGNSQDVAFNFVSTFNSSGNTVGASLFQNMATVIKINGGNGTVQLNTFGLNIGNVPVSTAFIDNSAASSSNYVSFLTPATGTLPAGIANTKDHLWCAGDASPLFRVRSVRAAANYVTIQPATSSNPPTIIIDGTDGAVNGVIQTKGGNLFINAAGGSGGSGNMLALLNMPGSTSWVQIQNATSGNLAEINTNTGGLSLHPKGALWLSPGTGLYVANLPTNRPAAGSGQVWNNNGVLSIA